MKNLLLLVLLISNACYLQAQNALSTRDKGITTNPDNPVNTEKPSKKNTFDWRAESFTVYSDHLSDNFIYSPFDMPNNTNVSHFLNNKAGYLRMVGNYLNTTLASPTTTQVILLWYFTISIWASYVSFLLEKEENTMGQK